LKSKTIGLGRRKSSGSGIKRGGIELPPPRVGKGNGVKLGARSGNRSGGARKAQAYKGDRFH